MLYQPPVEPDEGLFYVRVWVAGSDQWDEQKFTSLAAAHVAIAAVYQSRAYSRVELLQAREWGTRSSASTDQK